MRVFVVYPAGAAGRLLGVVMKSLYNPTELVRPNSGHGNHVIKQFEFDCDHLPVNPFRDRFISAKHIEQVMPEFQQRWADFETYTRSKDLAVFTHQINLELLFRFLPRYYKVILIHADRADYKDELIWNFITKTFVDKPGDEDNKQTVRQEIIKWFRRKHGSAVSNYFTDEQLDNADPHDHLFWATLMSDTHRPGPFWERDQIEYGQQSGRDFMYFTYTEMRDGSWRNRLKELADFLGHPAGPDRFDNANRIIDRWLAHQVPLPRPLDIEYYRRS